MSAGSFAEFIFGYEFVYVDEAAEEVYSAAQVQFNGFVRGFFNYFFKGLFRRGLDGFFHTEIVAVGRIFVKKSWEKIAKKNYGL